MSGSQGAENPIEKAVWQLKQVCEHLPSRPISVWDSEYGCAPFVLKTANIPVDILVRLRSNLCLWGEQSRSQLARDALRSMVINSNVNVPTTWSDAASVLELYDPKLQRVRVSLWKNLPERKAATRPMLLIRVERLDPQGNLRVSKPLWLAQAGRRDATFGGSLAILLASLYD